jgi:zinc protease
VQSLSAAALPPPVDGRETRATYRLGNGVSVVLEENHVSPVVAAQLWVSAGAADEPPGAAGVAHVVERALLEGAREPELGGARVVGWTGPDVTVFETAVAAPFALAAVDALGALAAPTPLEAPAFARARAAAVEERRASSGDAAAGVRRALLAAAFGAHGYAHTALGEEAALGGLSLEQAAAFRRAAFTAPNLTLVVTGDFELGAARARVTSAFGALPEAEGALAARPPLPALAGPVAAVAAGEGATARVALGYRFSSDAVGVEVAELAAAALASGDEGLLPRAVVRNRQLAASVSTSVFVGRDACVLVVDAPSTTGNPDELARALVGAVQGLARDPLDRPALEAARARVEAAYARRGDTAAGRARRLGFFASVVGDVSLVDRDGARLGRVGASDLRTASARLFAPAALSLAAHVPPASAAARAPRAAEARLVSLATAAAREAAARAPAPGEGAAVATAGDVVRVTLPAGPRVVFVRDPSATTVAFAALWSGGVRFEDARTNGATAMLAALLPRGTRTRDAERVVADAAAAGGALVGVSGRDELGLRLEVLAGRWESGLDLLVDSLLHPALADDEVERARRALLDRVRAREDDAADAAGRLFAQTAFEASASRAYRLPELGTADSDSALSRGRLAEHFRRFYGAGNLTLAIVGDVEIGEVVARLRALFADAPAWSPPPTAAPTVAAPAPPATDAGSAPAATPTEVFRLAKGDDAGVVVGFPGVALRDPDRPAVELLARVLGAEDGPLARATGATTVAANAWSGVDGGALMLSLAGAPSALDAAVPALRGALSRVVESGVPAAALTRARRDAIAAHARGLERRSGVALSLARDEAFGLPLGATRALGAAYAAVTPAVLARVARRVLDPSREIVAAVRPPAPPPAVAKVAPKTSAAIPSSAPTTGGRRVPAP